MESISIHLQYGIHSMDMDSILQYGIHSMDMDSILQYGIHIHTPAIWNP